MAKHCEGCAERDRLSLDITSHADRNTDKPETAARALAGLSVTLAPFQSEEVD